MSVLLNDEVTQRRLQEELIFCISQFHKYASMPLLQRNSFVVETLEELLHEAHNMKLHELGG